MSVRLDRLRPAIAAPSAPATGSGRGLAETWGDAHDRSGRRDWPIYSRSPGTNPGSATVIKSVAILAPSPLSSMSFRTSVGPSSAAGLSCAAIASIANLTCLISVVTYPDDGSPAPRILGRRGNTRAYSSTRRPKVAPRTRCSAAALILLDATGSTPAAAWPLTWLAAERAPSGECVSGLPSVTALLGHRRPVAVSIPRGR